MKRTRHITRGERAGGQPFALLERDQDVLLLIGLVGYLSTAQVARELFPSEDRARRRLRRLFDARLVTITIASSTAPNLVSLTPQGRNLVLERHPDLAARLTLPGTIRLAGVAHHLAVVDARLYLAALGRLTGSPLLAWSNAHGDLVRRLGFPRFGLVPDGVAELARGQDVFRVAVEVDRGTEGVSGALSAKLARYLAVLSERVVGELWLVVDAGASRARTLAEAVHRAGLGRETRVVEREHLLSRPVQMPPARVQSETGTHVP